MFLHRCRYVGQLQCILPMKANEGGKIKGSQSNNLVQGNMTEFSTQSTLKQGANRPSR